MNLTSEIDFKQIALEAGLKKRQAEEFASKLSSNRGEPLILPRELYTELQKKFERAILDVLQQVPLGKSDDSLCPPFLYRTPLLATPLHNSLHPRAENTERMLTHGNPERPLAFFVSNAHELEGITRMRHFFQAEQRERTARLLSPRGVDPFIATVSQQPLSYMAMNNFRGIGIVFDAAQSPTLMNNRSGAIKFGDEAFTAYDRGLADFCNGDKKSSFIKRKLGLTK